MVRLSSDFGQAGILSYPLLLRGYSETSHLRRAGDSDLIIESSPRAFKILLGAQRMADTDVLAAKFSWRENCRRGRIPRRPCLCGESSCLARVFRPVHQIWPRIESSARSHGFLFPRLTASIFRRWLKGCSVEAGIDRVRLLSPHCFRRGATQRLLTDGASADSLKSAGCWGGDFGRISTPK